MKSVISATAVALLAAQAAAIQHKSCPPRDKCKALPLVDSDKLQAAVKVENLLKHSKKLEEFAFSTPARNRQFGTDGHLKTVEYIVDTLNSYGGYYSIEKQPFEQFVQLSGSGSFSVGGVDYKGSLFDYSGSGSVEAPIIVVNAQGCEASDYPATVKGNIALILRGVCDFGLKSALAGAAGAKAAIIYDRIAGDSLAGTLGIPPRPEGPYVATLGITQAQGQELVAKIAAGEVIGKVEATTDIQKKTTYNVIATSKCGGNSTLVLGAHTDSVAAGPGINDDGSGTVALLELAGLLAKYRTNNVVKFGFWTGEESGLLGSTYYVEHLTPEQLAPIRAYLNFDMIASPNFVHAIYDGNGDAFNQTGPAGSGQIESFFLNYFASKGLATVPTAFDGRSDYLPFIDAGIASGGTFTGAEEAKTEEEARLFGGVAGKPYDEFYHKAGDDYNNLSHEAFIVHSKAIAASVAYYSSSFSSLPPKEATAATRRKRSIRKPGHGNCSKHQSM